MTRRTFHHLALILTPLAYTGGILAAMARYLSPLPPPRRKSRLDAGPASEFEAGKVGRVDFNGRSIFILRDQGRLVALDATCTHLACNVNWNERQACFVCPCHGGRFDRGGQAIRKPVVDPLRPQPFAIEGGRVVLLDQPAGAGS